MVDRCGFDDFVPGVAVHGGSGAAPSTAAKAAARRAGVELALCAAYELLEAGRSALDVVCAAVTVLEDDGAFNAGRGALPTVDGSYELDAAVMVGEDRRAGAVAAVSGVRNPVLLARAVMEQTPHVLLVGEGAIRFAARAGLAAPGAAHEVGDEPAAGTVGAVALDRRGHLAAATSTGGRTGQLRGRVGDSPLIGAGTYAHDETCAVSGTGDGEVFVRTVFAGSIAARVAAGVDLDEACRAALADVTAAGGRGGCIAMTRAGTIVLRRTTEAMPRGWASLGRDLFVRID